MKKQILFIHDNENQHAIILALRKEYRVTAMADGISAVEWLEAGNTADVIITGLHTSYFSCFDFIRAIRLSTDFRHLPLMVLTSETDSRFDRIECLELGADDCISTPIHPLEMVAKVKSLLRRTARAYEAVPASLTD